MYTESTIINQTSNIVEFNSNEKKPKNFNSKAPKNQSKNKKESLHQKNPRQYIEDPKIDKKISKGKNLKSKGINKQANCINKDNINNSIKGQKSIGKNLDKIFINPKIEYHDKMKKKIITSGKMKYSNYASAKNQLRDKAISDVIENKNQIKTNPNITKNYKNLITKIEKNNKNVVSNENYGQDKNKNKNIFNQNINANKKCENMEDIKKEENKDDNNINQIIEKKNLNSIQIYDSLNDNTQNKKIKQKIFHDSDLIIEKTQVEIRQKKDSFSVSPILKKNERYDNNSNDNGNLKDVLNGFIVDLKDNIKTFMEEIKAFIKEMKDEKKAFINEMKEERKESAKIRQQNQAFINEMKEERKESAKIRQQNQNLINLMKEIIIQNNDLMKKNAAIEK